MMNKPKISIVIPVYNAEKFLNKCVDSILSQTFENIECILVDDGSEDNSGAICDEFAQKDKRVRVIHKENEGVSVARSTGIKEALGEYVGFVDADDYLAPEMCAEMNRIASEKNYDIIMFDTYIVDSENKTENLPTDSIDLLPESCELTKNDIYPMLLRFMAGVVWRCVYNKEFLEKNSISFPTALPMSEDRIFNLIAMGSCEKMYFYKEPLYYYINYGVSAVRTARKNFFDIALKTNEIMQEVLEKYWNAECVKLYDKINIVDGALHHISDLGKIRDMKFNEKIKSVKEVLNNSELQRILSEQKKLKLREKMMKNKQTVLLYLLEGKVFNLIRKFR